jgi:hypothetical protein
MSKKTSTAALDSFRKGRLRNQRRAPRHPAGGRRSKEVRKQRNDDSAREFGQAQIVVRRKDVMNGKGVSGAAEKFRVIFPVILRITFCLAMWTLGVMSMTIAEAQTQKHRAAQDNLVRDASADKLQSPGDAAHDLWRRIRGEKISRESFD